MLTSLDPEQHFHTSGPGLNTGRIKAKLKCIAGQLAFKVEHHLPEPRGAMSVSEISLIGCRISIISKAQIRYEGFLHSVDCDTPNEPVITLSKGLWSTEFSRHFSLVLWY